MTVKVKDDFDFSRLKDLGYYENILQGGFIAPNGATIVVNNRKPYNSEVLQYCADYSGHKENIDKLREAGIIDEVS